MSTALDANRLTDLFQGDAAPAAFLGNCGEIRIPFVVLAEIKAGFYGGARQTKNEALLARPMALKTVSILFAERETTEQYARLFVQSLFAQSLFAKASRPARRSRTTTCGSRRRRSNTIRLR
jgi:predicted nucleic acid-binding protein